MMSQLWASAISTWIVGAFLVATDPNSAER
jgi:hypothetical protein